MCGENHTARQRYEREKVSNGTESLEEKYLTDLRTIEDLAVIFLMEDADDEDERNEELDNHVEWAEREDDIVISFTASGGREAEQQFSMLAFCY